MQLVYIVTWIVIHSFVGECPRTEDKYGLVNIGQRACVTVDTTHRKAMFLTLEEANDFVSEAPEETHRPVEVMWNGELFKYSYGEVYRPTDFSVDTMWVPIQPIFSSANSTKP